MRINAQLTEVIRLDEKLWLAFKLVRLAALHWSLVLEWRSVLQEQVTGDGFWVS